jgi:hypothetical protein
MDLCISVNLTFSQYQSDAKTRAEAMPMERMRRKLLFLQGGESFALPALHDFVFISPDFAGLYGASRPG